MAAVRTIDPLTLDAAFCGHDSRRIDRGVVKVRGKRFSHPLLASLPGRTAVDIALPWRRDAAPLAQIPNSGWVRLKEDAPYPARWLEGARSSSRRQNVQTRQVASLVREAPPARPNRGQTADGISSQPHRIASGRSAHGFGQQSDEDLGAALATAPATWRRPDEALRRREMAITERLERRHGVLDD